MRLNKEKVSTVLKILTVLISLGGVTVSFFGATYDGYSHWAKRLLYFTAQSNIWISVTYIAILLLPLLKGERREVWTKRLYLLKFIFTVSITVTGVVFCGLLAPFADENYHAWSVSSIMTHVLTPILAIVDYFLDSGKEMPTKRHALLAMLPPALYLIFAMVLGFFQVDFGRGDPFPYFFMDTTTPAGLFGAVLEPKPNLGTVYWIILFVFMVLGFALLYRKLHPGMRKKK